MSDRTKLQVRMPYRPRGANRRLLQSAIGSRSNLEYEQGVFRVARRTLIAVVAALVEEFGEVEVTLQYNALEKCDKRCQEANPDFAYLCECSCLGVNHGGSDSMHWWIEVGDTTLISPGLRQVRTIVTRAQLIRK